MACAITILYKRKELRFKGLTRNHVFSSWCSPYGFGFISKVPVMDSHWLPAGLVYFDALMLNKLKGSIQVDLVLCESPDDFNRFSIH